MTEQVVDPYWFGLTTAPIFLRIASQNNQVMMHVKIKVTETTCILIFKATFRHDDNSPAEIIRIYPDGRGMKYQRGSVIGIHNRKAALAITARQGDIVRIQEYGDSNRYIQSHFFKVMDDRTVARLGWNSGFQNNKGIRALLRDARRGPLRQFHLDSTQYIRVFGSRWPDWLKKAICDCMENPGNPNSEAWWKVDPESISDESILKVASENPEVALELYGNRLDEMTRLKCIGKDFKLAIRFGAEDLSHYEMEYAVKDFPEQALKHAAGRLNEDQFRDCVRRCFVAAFESREIYPSKQRAIILSLAVRFQKRIIGEILDGYFISEIFESMHQNYEEWIVTFEGDHPMMFRELESAMKIKPEKLYKELIGSLPEAGKNQLAIYISSFL